MAIAHKIKDQGQKLAQDPENIHLQNIHLEDIHLALQRILASGEFRASPRLSSFLSFCVQRSIEGRADTLKAYTIARQVFMRPDHFDPQADPIVRVEATRLRRAMQRYYSQEGMDDPLHLNIERGQYGVRFVLPPARDHHEAPAVPQLTVSLLERLAVIAEGRTAHDESGGGAGATPAAGAPAGLALVPPDPPPLADPASADSPAPAKPPRGFAGIVLPFDVKLILAGLSALAVLFVIAWHNMPAPIVNQKADKALLAKAGPPLLVFQPAKLSVVVESPAPDVAVWADDVRDALAHFDSIIVLDGSVQGEKRGGQPDFQLSIRKTIRGSLMLRLAMIGSGEIIWSREVASKPVQDDPDHLLAQWLTDIAAWDGVINRKHWNAPLWDNSDGTGLPCQHQAMQALLAQNLELIRRARSCFDRDLASGQLWNKPHWRLRLDVMAVQLGDPSAGMGEILAEAQRLIKQSPLTPSTYVLAGQLLQAMGRNHESRDMLAKAHVLNPYDLGPLKF